MALVVIVVLVAGSVLGRCSVYAGSMLVIIMVLVVIVAVVVEVW